MDRGFGMTGRCGDDTPLRWMVGGFVCRGTHDSGMGRENMTLVMRNSWVCLVCVCDLGV